MPQTPCDGPEPSENAQAEKDVTRFLNDYEVNPDQVAEALLARIDEMADERARFRRSLIYSVEMIEAPDLDTGSVDVK